VNVVILSGYTYSSASVPRHCLPPIDNQLKQDSNSLRELLNLICSPCAAEGAGGG